MPARKWNLTVVYRSLSVIVTQYKNCPFGVIVTIELQNITAAPDSNDI
jgi:hypothetical protein